MHPPSDHSIDVSRRAAFNGLLSRVVPRRVFVFGVFRPQSADRPKKPPHFSPSNTTTAQTQMEDLPFVCVQEHQISLENTELLMKMDVFVCLVAQGPGISGGLRPPGPPLRNSVWLGGVPPDVGLRRCFRAVLGVLLYEWQVFHETGDTSARPQCPLRQGRLAGDGKPGSGRLHACFTCHDARSFACACGDWRYLQ